MALSRDGPIERFHEEAHAGNLVEYSEASDGEVELSVYVDESPKPELFDLAEGQIEARLLRVPSGRLVFAGLEYVRGGEGVEMADDYRYPQGMGSDVRIPPGDYAYRAFSMDWDEMERRVDQEVRRVVDSRSLRLSHMVDRASNGLFLLTALLVVLSAVLFFENRGGSHETPSPAPRIPAGRRSRSPADLYCRSQFLSPSSLTYAMSDAYSSCWMTPSQAGILVPGLKEAGFLIQASSCSSPG